MKPRAIFIFTPGFASSEADTTCIPFLQQFCLSLKKINPETKIVVFAFQYPFEARSYTWNGIPVFAFGGANRKGLSKFALWFRVMQKFARLKNEYEVAGIFSIWLSETALVGKIVSSIYSLKHFIWVVGQDARKENRYINFIRPEGEQLIAFSSFIRQQLRENFRLNAAHLIENGINPEMFEPLNTGVREIAILGVGSLVPVKRFDRFIEIIGEVNRQTPLSKVMICGDGPEKERLMQIIREKGLEHIIELPGNLPHKTVLLRMNQSRILLHTAEYEGGPAVVHEALYAGCAVVSTCPVDLHGESRFFLLKTQKEIADKIVSLLKSEETNIGRGQVILMEESARKVSELFNQ